MIKHKRSVWLIRAGGKSEAEHHFLQRKTLALGPAEVGDLSNKTDLQMFKDRFRLAFPEATPGGIGGSAAQLFRFANEATIDDVVVYPSKQDGHVHVGFILGPYHFDVSKGEPFPHQRAVEWKCKVARSEMSTEFLKEARAFKSFYSIKKCDAEVLLLLDRVVKQSKKAPNGH